MGSANLDETLRCTRCGYSLKLASPTATGYRCLTCHADTPGTRDDEPGDDPMVIVRSYKAKSHDRAAADMQADAEELAARGYHPVSQSWSQGQWGCGAFALAALLILLVGLGLLILAYLLIVKPDGTLVVTYERRGA